MTTPPPKLFNRVLLVAAVVMASASLRPAMASLAPLVETIRLDLALSFGVVGLLTTIPVVCLGVFPIAANRLAANIGLERALLAALGLITLATALRLAGDQTALLFLSTLIIGIGVAGGQAYVPALAKRYFGAKAPAITALYGVIMTASAVSNSHFGFFVIFSYANCLFFDSRVGCVSLTS